MAEDKNKKVDELGKNELGEISGGINFGGLIKKPHFPFTAPKAKYGCPIPPEKRREEILKDNNQDSEE